MEPFEAFWRALTAVGTSLALALIIALALSIAALSLFYLGSAVVVLERFARRARRWPGLLIAWAIASAAYAAIALQPGSAVSGGPDGAWAPEPALLIGASALLTALAMTTTSWLLRVVSPGRVAVLGLVVPGLAGGLFVGASGRIEYALAGPLAVGLASLTIAAVRLKRGRARRAGEAERGMRWLALALCVGIPVAAALPGEEPEIAFAALNLLQLFVAVVLFGLLPLALAAFSDMSRSAEWFVASRYLIARRRQVFISAVTFLCTCGIAAGVWLIIIVLSVMNGFEETWRSQIVGNRAHFTVHGILGSVEDYAAVARDTAQLPGIVSASPYLEAEGMVRAQRGQILAIRLRGIDAEDPEVAARLGADLTVGRIEDLRPSRASEDDWPGIILGHELAREAGVEVGDDVLLIAPLGGPDTPLGPAPRLVRYRLVGIFETSFYQYDQLYAYVTLPAAQAFRNAPDIADGIEVRTEDFFASRQTAREVRTVLGRSYFTRDWKDYFPAFFEALEDNRALMLILLSMVMVVAAFTIVATLLMMIMEKSQDIAILKAMGASEAMIERIFAIEGALIGLAGTALGVIAGVAVTSQLAWVQEQIESVTGIDTLPASIYQVSSLPAEIDPVQVAVIAGIAMVLSLGATLVPSRQGARIDPVEGLRDA